MMKRKDIGRNARGFTLIEMLVATTIFVLVLTAVYGTFRSVTQAGRRAGTAAEVTQTARVVLEDISKSLSSFYPMPLTLESTDYRTPSSTSRSRDAEHSAETPPSLIGEERTARDGAEMDSLFFVTVGDDAVDRRRLSSGMAQVKYYLEEYESAVSQSREGFGQPRRALIREVQPLLGPSVGGEPERIIISDQVRALHFQYFDPEENKWMPSWNDSKNLPEAVSIQIAIESSKDNRSTVEKFSRIVPLPSVTRFSQLPESKAPAPIGGSGGGGRPSGVSDAGARQAGPSPGGQGRGQGNQPQPTGRGTGRPDSGPSGPGGPGLGAYGPGTAPGTMRVPSAGGPSGGRRPR